MFVWVPLLCPVVDFHGVCWDAVAFERSFLLKFPWKWPWIQGSGSRIASTPFSWDQAKKRSYSKGSKEFKKQKNKQLSHQNLLTPWNQTFLRTMSFDSKIFRPKKRQKKHMQRSRGVELKWALRNKGYSLWSGWEPRDLNHNPVIALSMGLFWDDIFLHKDEKKWRFPSQWRSPTTKKSQKLLWGGRRDQGSCLVPWLAHLAKAHYFGSSGFAEDWKWSAPANCQATFLAPGNKRRAVLS